MVKKAQLLEDATDFTDRIKGKLVKKELTSGQSSARPNNGKKHPLNLTKGPSQERKPKAIVPYIPAKSNCKHCDKLGHTADECWRKVGVSECGGPAPIPECLSSRVPQVLCEPGTLWLLCSGFVPVHCGTVEVCVVFLDTLTPEFELYVRLRERRQWDSHFSEFVLLSLGAPARDPRGARHGPAAYGCRCGVGWSPQLFDFFLVERQLDLSSVTARLRGVLWFGGAVLHGGRVFSLVVRLGGPPDWAQSAHRFSACERDRGVRRVLNATTLGVAFLLPPLSIDVCMRAKCRALGGLLMSGNPAEQSFHRLCSTRGSCCGVSLGGSRWRRCVGRVLAVRTSCGAGEMPGVRVLREGFAPVKATTLGVAFLTRQPDVSRSDLERDMSKGRVLKATWPLVATSAESGASALVTLMERIAHECGTVEVCVVFLDTLTPKFELHVRLRERRQWDSHFPEFVLLSLGAPARDPRGARHGPAAYGCRCSVGWSPQLFDFFLVERQLDLSSMTARLFDQFEMCPGVGTVVTELWFV
ncbi:hypothetical protein Taro_043361 [Colocasia esculenta]|uniref:Uncharacterized protein n=1 Tax=Colocasia esculenta TaxID=4460 RepID=A0A843WR73_COLES|nr:hypothetical protein [Colocasia esculenta]